MRRTHQRGIYFFRRPALPPCHALMTFADLAAAIPRTAVTRIDDLPFPRLGSGKAFLARRAEGASESRPAVSAPAEFRAPVGRSRARRTGRGTA